MDKNNGFTLIELIVVISIALVFLGISLPRYNDYSSQLKLKNEAKKLIDVFELAKKKALSSDLIVTPLVTPPTYCTDFTGYRIAVSANFYLLQYGCSSVYTTVQTYSFSSNITATTGVGDFDFPPLMINPAFVSNTITLRNSILGKCVDISISSVGIIELDENLRGC